MGKLYVVQCRFVGLHVSVAARVPVTVRHGGHPEPERLEVVERVVVVVVVLTLYLTHESLHARK